MTYPRSELANLAVSTIATTALTATANSVTLHSGDGALFPANAPYLVRIGTPLGAANEIVAVTARATDTLTITRGQEGTQPQAWPVGTPVQLLDRDVWGLGTALASLAKTTATGIAPLKTNAAQTLAVAGTIATANLAISRVNPSAANATGVILAAGTTDGQVIIVENDHATHTVTFDVAATSNVADGTSDVIAALTAAMYVWNGTTSRWVHVA